MTRTAHLLFLACTTLLACTVDKDTPSTETGAPDTASTDTAVIDAGTCPEVADAAAALKTTVVTELDPSGCSQTTTNTPCAPHRLWEPADVSRDALLVFLPGTGMEPDKHDQIAQMAAAIGYRVLILSYDTSNNMNDFCQPTGDLDCHGAVRDVALFGGEHTVGKQRYAIETAQAVVPRLLSVLDGTAWGAAHLIRPPKGAGDTAAIDWSRIALAGFSMGGGQAGRLSQHQAVQGVLMIDGVKDPVLIAKKRVYASWPSEPSATSGCRYFGAYHGDGSEVGELVGQWLALGMPDVEADADVLPFARGDAHRVLTAQQIVPGESAHSSMAKDGSMPADATTGQLPAQVSEVHLFEPYISLLCAIDEAADCE